MREPREMGMPSMTLELRAFTAREVGTVGGGWAVIMLDKGGRHIPIEFACTLAQAQAIVRKCNALLPNAAYESRRELKKLPVNSCGGDE